VLPQIYEWGLGEPKGSTQGDPLTTEGPSVGETEVKGKKSENARKRGAKGPDEDGELEMFSVASVPRREQSLSGAGF
jgi:hypothetical protein